MKSDQALIRDLLVHSKYLEKVNIFTYEGQDESETSFQKSFITQNTDAELHFIRYDEAPSGVVIHG